MDKKRCKICQLVLPLEEFDKNQYNKAGEVVRRSECRDCRKYKKPIPAAERKKFEASNKRPAIGESFICPVCQRALIIEKIRDVNLDHDHHTGAIRGYVCNDCNTGMGKFKDDVFKLERAIYWLKGCIKE